MSPRNPWGDFQYANVWTPGHEPAIPPEDQIIQNLDDWRRHQFSSGHAASESLQELNLYWHPEQWKVFVESQARFKVVDAGWGWGKSIGAAQYIVKKAMEKPGVYWWVAPTYSLAQIAQKSYLNPLIPASALAQPYHQTKQVWNFRNGSEIYLKTAENEATLLGERLDGLVMDEAARCKESVWINALRGRLTGKKGAWALFISSPLGMNWFYQLFLKGQPGGERAYESWRFPTSGNPMIDQDEVESARRDLPALLFAQNYEAAFLSTGASFFPPFLRELATALREAPLALRRYVVGMDVAKLIDWTALFAYDLSIRCPVRYRRTQRVPYTDLGRMTADVVRELGNGEVWFDSTGVGEAVHDILDEHRLRLSPYILTEQTRRDLLERYRLELERRAFWVVDDPVVIAEHEAFRLSVSPRGRPIYQAPAGQHDDTVFGTALACMGCVMSGPGPVVAPQRPRKDGDDPSSRSLPQRQISGPPRSALRKGLGRLFSIPFGWARF